MLERFNVVGSVLYVAAHPDDENTKLITYLTHERKVRTSYISLTRGDGGQNLIGPEQGIQLGLIRTQELLAARKIDKAFQYFSRANDFGFSKTPEETFTIWDKEKILADLVWVIRKTRPDVIITRFSAQPGKTHGHHTASTWLAQEAFRAAADPRRFPEQLVYVQPWQAHRLVWNTSRFFFDTDAEFRKDTLLSVEVGQWNPWLGKSLTEIAAQSRSMHKSQGFGTSATRGSQLEYIAHLAGSKAQKDLFEGIDLTWSRVTGGSKVQKLIQKVLSKFNYSEPSALVPELIEIYQALQAISDPFWKEEKMRELQAIIQACLGLYLEVTTDEYYANPGNLINIQVEAVNRSPISVFLRQIIAPNAKWDTSLSYPLAFNIPLTFKAQLRIPEDAPISQPYWLVEKGNLGQFTILDQRLVGKPENDPAQTFTFSLLIEKIPFVFSIPLVFKKTDPVKGEIYNPFYITPPIVLKFEQSVVLFPTDHAKAITINLRSVQANTKGILGLKLPAKWKAVPLQQSWEILQKGEEKKITFLLYPPQNPEESIIEAYAQVDGKEYNLGMEIIEYEHIPTQVYFPRAQCKLVRIDVQKKGENIGYIMGAGDEIPQSLEQIGYKVTLLQEQDLRPEKLKFFDAIITGVRAYNTLTQLKYAQPILLEYVKNGGTLIVQYNTSHQLVTSDLGPYPLKLSRDRVTVEDSPVEILEPKHPALSSPNPITLVDFRGWVQERGLYFPSEWAPEYTALIACNDPGEAPKKGSILVARYGKGYYVYTSLSWFRQLPAGVSGAFRILANLISLGK
ncbi:MAG: PIG-L family deacetylase [Bacteroidia bacterium]|nr:PIG-L family deacetylase [Bacteroidia bacterium]MDW8158010.1 PIG-L family deacetylase [Bacteroidia bacterium]